MKFEITSMIYLALLCILLAGCGGGREARNSTDGASKSAIEEYEAAVKAAEGTMDAE
jgi:hypothetical protein